MIVVADLHQLNQRNKEIYVVDGTKTLERKGMKVEQSYVDTVNGNSKTNGKIFVVDEEATKQWKKDNAAHAEAKKEAEKKRKLGLTEEAEALLAKKAEHVEMLSERAKKRKEAVKNEIPAELITEYVEMFGKEPHKKMKAETIRAKIDEEKAKAE